MSNHRKFSRRTFLAASGSAVIFSGGVSAQNPVSKKSTFKSPNEKLNVAAIGAGGKGESDVNGCGRENIVALCDVDFERGAKTFKRYPQARVYRDFRVMLDDMPEIDAVTVTTPDHTHAVAAMACMERGKHVYVQKPLTHSIREARMLQEAAHKYGVATQMGNQGNSLDGVRKLCEMIWNGDIGEVREVHCWTNRPVWPQNVGRPSKREREPATMYWDLWIGPAPKRPYHPAYAPFNWRGWWDFGCGALGDMACHIMDPPYQALRLAEVKPESIEPVSIVGGNNETGPEKSTIKYEFPARGDMPPVTLYWHDGGHRPDRPKGVSSGTLMGDGGNGTLFLGSKRVATCDTYGDNPRLLPDKLMNDYEWPAETVARVPNEDHYQNWIDACKGGPAGGSNFDYASPFTETVLLGNVALRTGKKIQWDAKKMKVTNVRDADQLFIEREYREGWSLT